MRIKNRIEKPADLVRNTQLEQLSVSREAVMEPFDAEAGVDEISQFKL
jgi:hypothetical protein